MAWRKNINMQMCTFCGMFFCKFCGMFFFVFFLVFSGVRHELELDKTVLCVLFAKTFQLS